jgi:hypothetical protein
MQDFPRRAPLQHPGRECGLQRLVEERRKGLEPFLRGVQLVVPGGWLWSRRFVSVAAGRGGVLANRYAAAKVPAGGSVWTFALTP